MPIYNISYRDKEQDKLINLELGRPYSILDKIKIGGVGSRRMVLEGFSSEVKSLKSKVSGLQYGSIEIRPKGIILHINRGLDVFAWTIPFYHLSIFNGNSLKIHGGADYVQFVKEKSWEENRGFFERLLKLKSKFYEEPIS